MVTRYERSSVYYIFTSEHTEMEDVDGMWEHIPDGVTFQCSEPAPAGFGDLAHECVMSTLTLTRGGLSFGFTKEIFFATQVVQRLW